MALKGTIRDFGVADIFQLIGQQVKTGALHLTNDVDEVRVFFKDGRVVRSDSRTRPAQMLIGSMMVRAGVLTKQQLKTALAEQKRTLKRIGVILVEYNFVDANTISEFASLQMTETLYDLFTWKDGDYEFEAVAVDPSPEGIEPIAAESIVMNGIRMVDEWPAIREKLPSYGWEAECVAPLPPDGSVSVGGLDDIGPSERLVYELVAPERTIQQIIDLSRLGEFDTCHALSVLMSAGLVRAFKPSRAGPKGLTFVGFLQSSVRQMARVAASACVVFLGGTILLNPQFFETFRGQPSSRIRPSEVKVFYAMSAWKQKEIQRTLEAYHWVHGSYPVALEKLVEDGWLSSTDLNYPFGRVYYYRSSDEKPVLLPPLPAPLQGESGN